LDERHEIGVLVHLDALIAQRLPEQALVVVLPEDEDKRIRAEVAPDVPERYACGPCLRPIYWRRWRASRPPARAAMPSLE
jgi:hypothetical protein